MLYGNGSVNKSLGERLQQQLLFYACGAEASGGGVFNAANQDHCEGETVDDDAGKAQYGSELNAFVAVFIAHFSEFSVSLCINNFLRDGCKLP